jgi:hypothetical protein
VDLLISAYDVVLTEKVVQRKTGAYLNGVLKPGNYLGF